VSRAFQILSDPEKKGKYDRFGGDPESRASAPSSSPFSSFAGASSQSSGFGGQSMWEEEISPEEMFNRFFGGGMGPFGGGGLFDSGPQFMFNLGGGPGFRVHQFGGATPRRRPRQATRHADDTPVPAPSLTTTLSNLLPLLIIFILPLLSTLFSGESAPSGPKFRFDSPSPPLTYGRKTDRLGVKYWVDPKEVEGWGTRKWSQLDQRAEVALVGQLRAECEVETERRNQMVERARGWFWTDEALMDAARGMEMRGCRRLDELRVGRRN
jgi:DnaJ family protein B protein 12